MNTKDSLILPCEVTAPSRSTALVLGRIAQACARDVGVTLDVHPKVRRANAEKVVTLEMSAEMAASQNPAWCLACRLACFCPDARVSVLVRSEELFADARKNSTTRTKHHRREPAA